MTISTLSSTFMGFTAFVCIASPFLFWLVVREKVEFRQALFGVLTYFVFVIILKSMVDSIVLADGQPILNNKIQYVLYVVCVSALFEEVSKYAFFKLYMKNKYERCTAAVGFGIGFAGYSSIYVGIMAISNFALALTVQNYGIDNVIAESAPESAAELQMILEGMCSADPWGFFMEGINKLFFIIQQIAMSVLVWYAATRDDCQYLLPGSLVLHAAISVPVALYQFDGSLGLIKADIIYCVMVTLVALFAYWIFKKKEPTYYDFKPNRLQAKRRR
ncbi:MAG: YhfC family intramembrane metalloprotease [Ruminococcaceae bacterium]|nr:YhfC family intramembrane metalloprotease [Oscillospiraceae bacterium]